jgi:hypothetical protein
MQVALGFVCSNLSDLSSACREEVALSSVFMGPSQDSVRRLEALQDFMARFLKIRPDGDLGHVLGIVRPWSVVGTPMKESTISTTRKVPGHRLLHTQTPTALAPPPATFGPVIASRRLGKFVPKMKS